MDREEQASRNDIDLRNVMAEVQRLRSKIEENDKFKKLNLNQGMISNKPILNIDGVKNKAIRMPSHSSNKS
jgi:hypothetical protein